MFSKAGYKKGHRGGQPRCLDQHLRGSDSRKYLDMDKLRELDISEPSGKEPESYPQAVGGSDE